MEPEVLPPPEAAELKGQALTLIDRARQITITNQPEYEVACAELVRVANVKKGIERAFAEPKSKAFAAHRAISKLENDLLLLPTEAERLYKGAIARYQTEQARVRREEQARIEQELRKKAEEDRLAEAQELSDAGQPELAEQLLDRPVFAPVVEIAAPSAPGVSTRKHFSYRLKDVSKMNSDFKIPDETKIRKTVNALGLDAIALIGEGSIEVIEDSIVAVRA